jgi:hypothetical protein
MEIIHLRTDNTVAEDRRRNLGEVLMTQANVHGVILM